MIQCEHNFSRKSEKEKNSKKNINSFSMRESSDKCYVEEENVSFLQ